jgi:hypothetical protein
MSTRLPRWVILAILSFGLAAATAHAKDDGGLQSVARDGRARSSIGPAPAPLPVSSPAEPGDDDMPERSGPKAGQAGNASEAPRETRWVRWWNGFKAQVNQLVQR